MKLYQITSKGSRLARSINSPDSPAMRVLYYMDKHGSASNEQITASAGVDEGDISTAIGKLRRQDLIREV
jgi:DNA-binding MarR family transcriptional regulator